MTLVRKKSIFSIRIIVIIIILFLFIKGWIIPYVSHLAEINVSPNELDSRRKLGQIEYLKLFKIEPQNKIDLTYSYITKSKHPFLFFDYLGKYQIGIYKLNVHENISLNKLVEFKVSTYVKSDDVIYEGYESGNKKFLFATAGDSILERLNIVYDGSLSKIIVKSDTLLSNNVQLKNITFSFKPSGITDLVFKVGKSNMFEKSIQRLEMNITIMRKNKSVFLIIIYPYGKKGKIEEGLVGSLFDIS